ncbi:hypothetical protein B0H63DRAFT_446802 [Podospora didyma]|uniref:Uncharacterized protein n=1 Tax=Podospora didyma TaxID=330526 RepID=A0AAE0NZR9_9PEZI|nr:hypothetical protein B0H63DRAFT_446802 [Podospora didyma]
MSGPDLFQHLKFDANLIAAHVSTRPGLARRAEILREILDKLVKKSYLKSTQLFFITPTPQERNIVTGYFSKDDALKAVIVFSYKELYKYVDECDEKLMDKNCVFVLDVTVGHRNYWVDLGLERVFQWVQDDNDRRPKTIGTNLMALIAYRALSPILKQVEFYGEDPKTRSPVLKTLAKVEEIEHENVWKPQLIEYRKRGLEETTGGTALWSALIMCFLSTVKKDKAKTTKGFDKEPSKTIVCVANPRMFENVANAVKKSDIVKEDKINFEVAYIDWEGGVNGIEQNFKKLPEPGKPWVLGIYPKYSLLPPIPRVRDIIVTSHRWGNVFDPTFSGEMKLAEGFLALPLEQAKDSIPVAMHYLTDKYHLPYHLPSDTIGTILSNAPQSQHDKILETLFVKMRQIRNNATGLTASGDKLIKDAYKSQEMLRCLKVHGLLKGAFLQGPIDPIYHILRACDDLRISIFLANCVSGDLNLSTPIKQTMILLAAAYLAHQETAIAAIDTQYTNIPNIDYHTMWKSACRGLTQDQVHKGGLWLFVGLYVAFFQQIQLSGGDQRRT